jgi:purine-nucleoside phosphorylase
VGHPLEVEILQPRPGCPILYQRGRVHSYQGYDAHQTVFMVRLAALLGARTLVMTNAAGGLRPHHRPGDLVLLSDQLNLSGLNPLRGELPTSWGPQFPDMSDCFDPALRRLTRDKAEALGIDLLDGVYAGLAGPSYETPAEVRMLAALGADAVGMSTVLEVIAARHMGVRCLVISLITNPGAGVTGEPLDHEEVLVAGRDAASKLETLLAAVLGDEALYGE